MAALVTGGTSWAINVCVSLCVTSACVLLLLLLPLLLPLLPLLRRCGLGCASTTGPLPATALCGLSWPSTT
eukprot:SAG25_NODE_1_length_41698_cov_149.842015_3_plen_71_part_00